MNALSLFSNVGIAESYLHEEGIEVVVANELLKERADFYQHVYPNCNMICGDILDDKVFCKVLEESQKNNVEFIIATPPCQGMSPAGKKDPNDERNVLIKSVVKMILALQPKYVLIENVMQVLKTKIWFNNEQITIPDYLKENLSETYNFNSCQKIDSKYYGVPQQRKRAIFLLARKDTNVLWEFPTPSTKFTTLKDVIGDLN